MTWASLAKLTGVTAAYLSRIFTAGDRHGSVQLVLRISQATSLPVDRIIALRGRGPKAFAGACGKNGNGKLVGHKAKRIMPRGRNARRRVTACRS